jgi:hypothetical protein
MEFAARFVHNLQMNAHPLLAQRPSIEHPSSGKDWVLQKTCHPCEGAASNPPKSPQERAEYATLLPDKMVVIRRFAAQELRSE